MKHILSLLLTCCMVVTIVGCSKKTDDIEKINQVEQVQETTEVTTTSNSEERAMEGNMYLEGFPIVKEPITIKVAVADFWNVSDFGELQIPKEYEEMTNIEVEWIHITSMEQINLMFASGKDLPDLFMFLEYDKINELGMDGQLVAVQDLIEKYAPNIQSAMDKEPEAKKICTASDGNMYIIPSMYRSPGEGLRGNLSINETWLEALNLEMPTTVDEYYEVLKAFKEQDPNGNNEADEIPLILEWNNGINGIASLYGPWGVTSAAFGPFFAKDQKEIVVSVMEDDYKDAITYFRRLYKEGLIDQEAFTQDHDKYKSKISASVSGDIATIGSRNYFAPRDGYIHVPPLEGPKGKHHIIPVGGGIYPFNYISANTKYAKEIIRWADGIANPEMSYTWNKGPENIFWKINEEGKREIIKGDLKPSDYTYSLPIMGIYTEWVKENIVLSDNVKRKVEAIESVAPYGDQFLVSNDINGKIPLSFDQEELKFLTSHYADIVQYCKNKEAQWIMSGGVEEEWDTYIKQLQKMKIVKVQEMYQKALDKWNK